MASAKTTRAATAIAWVEAAAILEEEELDEGLPAKAVTKAAAAGLRHCEDDIVGKNVPQMKIK